MENEKWLEKLLDKFDSFSEKLIRIEESVKDLPGLKIEMDQMKIEIAQVKESSKSAHKRADTLEHQQKQKDDDIKWLKRQIMTGAIGWVFTVLAAVTIVIFKLK
jgi:chromosome segregation ATPase